jgi:hypothetical protein
MGMRDYGRVGVVKLDCCCSLFCSLPLFGFDMTLMTLMCYLGRHGMREVILF